MMTPPEQPSAPADPGSGDDFGDGAPGISLLAAPTPGPLAAPDTTTAAPVVRPILAEKYIIERELARGAMGRIYLATQRGLNRKVAVKVMSPQLGDGDFRRRFVLEATGLANLNHRNIVTVHDHGETSKGMLYLVLEYLDGSTISNVVKASGPMSVARTCNVTAQMLNGLRAAHRKGIVHRDLKPSNVFVVKSEDGDEDVKVLDFGIAKIFRSDESAQDESTRDGVLLGTPAFMAPEQINGGGVGPWTDLYALGCMMFYMLSGRTPFVSKIEVEILFSHLREPAPDVRTMPGCEALPESVAHYIARLLRKDPSERFADASDAINGLKLLSAELAATNADFRAEGASLDDVFGPSWTDSGSTGAKLLAVSRSRETGVGPTTGSTASRNPELDTAAALALLSGDTPPQARPKEASSIVVAPRQRRTAAAVGVAALVLSATAVMVWRATAVETVSPPPPQVATVEAPPALPPPPAPAAAPALPATEEETGDLGTLEELDQALDEAPSARRGAPVKPKPRMKPAPAPPPSPVAAPLPDPAPVVVAPPEPTPPPAPTPAVASTPPPVKLALSTPTPTPTPAPVLSPEAPQLPTKARIYQAKELIAVCARIESELKLRGHLPAAKVDNVTVKLAKALAPRLVDGDVIELAPVDIYWQAARRLGAGESRSAVAAGLADSFNK